MYVAQIATSAAAVAGDNDGDSGGSSSNYKRAAPCAQRIAEAVRVHLARAPPTRHTRFREPFVHRAVLRTPASARDGDAWKREAVAALIRYMKVRIYERTVEQLLSVLHARSTELARDGDVRIMTPNDVSRSLGELLVARTDLMRSAVDLDAEDASASADWTALGAEGAAAAPQRNRHAAHGDARVENDDDEDGDGVRLPSVAAQLDEQAFRTRARLRALEENLTLLRDGLSLVSNHMQFRVSSRLELIIVALIFVEVVIGLADPFF